MSVRLIGIVWLVLLSGTVRAETDYFFSAAVLQGDLSGFTQTSDGGVIGRSDVRRPTFAELGISDHQQWELRVGLQRDRHQLYLHSSLIHLDENTQLAGPLLSQWIQFPAGDSVNSDFNLSWYSLGYLFNMGELGQGEYSVGTELAMFDFHYKLNGSPARGVDRSYSRVALRLGATLDYPLSDSLSLSGSLYASAPVQTSPRINTFDVSLDYMLWQGNTEGRVSLGWGLHEIRFKDNQPMPNHIEADLGPLWRLGIEVSTAR